MILHIIVVFYAQDTLMDTGRDDKSMGHLLTLIQLEWTSPSAELIMTHILEQVRRKGSFSYFPYFGDFIIEVDFLEEFMSMANHEAKTVILDLFGGGSNGIGLVIPKLIC